MVAKRAQRLPSLRSGAGASSWCLTPSSASRPSKPMGSSWLSLESCLNLSLKGLFRAEDGKIHFESRCWPGEDTNSHLGKVSFIQQPRDPVSRTSVTHPCLYTNSSLWLSSPFLNPSCSLLALASADYWRRSSRGCSWAQTTRGPCCHKMSARYRAEQDLSKTRAFLLKISAPWFCHWIS